MSVERRPTRPSPAVVREWRGGGGEINQGRVSCSTCAMIFRTLSLGGGVSDTNGDRDDALLVCLSRDGNLERRCDAIKACRHSAIPLEAATRVIHQ